MLELMPPFYFLTFAKVSVSGLDEILWSRHSVILNFRRIALILAPATAMARNPSQMVIKEKPIKRPRVPPKSATCRLAFAFHVADFLN